MKYLETLNRRPQKAFLLVTICFLVLSCSEKTENKQKEKEAVKTEKTVTNIKADLKQNIPPDFKEFLDFVPTKHPPIRATCGFNDVISPASIPEEFHKWTKNQFGIYGKLTSKENVHYVLYGGISEIIVPYLYTYDNTGTVIDSIALIRGACGSDPEVAFSTSLIIDTNLHITTIDSGYNYSYIETESDYFRTLDSVDVIISETQVGPNGKTPPLYEVSKILVNDKTYSGQSTLYYWAPTEKLEKMKEKFGEENFNTSVDDVVFYSSQLEELVDSLGIKSYKDSVGTIGFIGTHSEYQANLAKTFEGEIFGAIYFDGVNPPNKINFLDQKYNRKLLTTRIIIKDTTSGPPRKPEELTLTEINLLKSLVDKIEVGNPKTISEMDGDIERQLTYLGTISSLTLKKKYHVITEFQTLGIKSMLSPRGVSRITFIDDYENIIYSYKAGMPDELPFRIDNNSLIFLSNNFEIHLGIRNVLPKFLCPQIINCID